MSEGTLIMSGFPLLHHVCCSAVLHLPIVTVNLPIVRRADDTNQTPFDELNYTIR